MLKHTDVVLFRSYGALDKNNGKNLESQDLKSDNNEALENDEDDDDESAPLNKKRKSIVGPHVSD